MWGFDLRVRISEMTAPGKGCTDYSILANVFMLSASIDVDGNSIFRRIGSKKRLACSHGFFYCGEAYSTHMSDELVSFEALC